MDRRSAISPKRGELLGKSCILPPGSVGGYPSPEEPPTPETSEDILRREMLMLTTHPVVRSVCRDLDTGGGPRARKGWNLRPSRVRGWRENAARPRDLRLDQAKEELPGWPGRATSGPAGLRNLRHQSVGGSATGRRIQASDQLRPQSEDERRACNVKLRRCIRVSRLR